KQEIVQDMMGQQMTTTQDIVSDYTYDIQSTENGVTAVNVTCSRLKMDSDIGGMQRLTYDSEAPEEGTNELKVMSSLIGKSFQLYVNEDGTVKKVDGLAEIISAVDEAQAELLKQTFGDSS